MSLTSHFKITLGASVCLLAALAVTPQVSQAVPSYARQTGLPCSTCHTIFPELTEFGRDFKLNGYTMTGLQRQIEQKTQGETAGVKINEIPPLSAMLQTSFTHTSKTQPDTQNNNVEFPHQFSFFFAGEISEHMGSFIQLTYDQESQHFGLDNTDIRYANQTQIGGAKTIYGLTLNNNPTVEDVWNSTPAWGFPWSSPSSAPTPAADALINGLGGDVAGIGGYTYWNDHLYAGVSLYRSAHAGQLAPDNTSSMTINGVAPYWRLAWEQAIGGGTLEVGTYGMVTKVYPFPGDGTSTSTGLSGPTDKYTDAALDMQYEHPVAPDDLLSIHSSYMHEKRSLDASSTTLIFCDKVADPLCTDNFASSNASDTLKTFRLDGTYHSGNEASFTLGYFNTTGSADALLYANGKPDSNGETVQASYLPWQNTKLSVQYTAYNKFDGTSDSAGDNNTLYVEAWFVW